MSEDFVGLREVKSMIDILSQAEVLLKAAGYRTWRSLQGADINVGFEDGSSIGFLYVFDTAAALLDTYESREETTLATYSSSLGQARAKALNVYSVFITSDDPGTDIQRRVLRVEENLHRTRKIARASVTSQRALEVALLPLLPIIARTQSKQSDYQERLANKITKAAGKPISQAFFGPASGEEIATMLQDS